MVRVGVGLGERREGELTATLMLATRSARELPIAKIVIPMMASERPKIVPKV